MTRPMLAVLLLMVAACTPRMRRVPEDGALRLLPLGGPIAGRDAEISGMAWYGETLVLLPQYPERFGGALFTLSKADIVARLEGRNAAPLVPANLSIDAAGISDLPGYEGFESIAFVDRGRVCLTVETSPAAMVAYLVCGEMSDEARGVRLDAAHAVAIPAPADLANMSHEALVVAGDVLLALFEANGARVNPRPVAHVFGLDLSPRGTAAFPPLDYRITDATPPDADGRFWAANVFYIGDTHLQGGPLPVERLVELQWKGGAVARTRRPEIVLPPIDGRVTRNWEAIARLDERGFLLATDRYPETLLAFVPRVSTKGGF